MNTLIDLNGRREQDIDTLIHAASEGKLDVRADARRYQGGHARVIAGMNAMLGPAARRLGALPARA